MLFAIGTVSGTILSFEIGLLWTTFTRFSGSIIGLPFALEGFAFFIEAIFLGLYLYGWDRLSPRAHLLRGKRESYYRKGLVLAMALGAYESKLHC